MSHPFDHSVLSAWLGDEEVARALGWEAELAAMLRFWVELAAAEADHGAIPREAAGAIARAAPGFAPDLARLREATRRDGMTVPGLAAQLRGAVGPPHGAHLHHGATSQDVIDTALALRLAPVLDLLGARLDGLTRALDALDARWGARPLMATTRMRAALPIAVSDRIAGWRGPLARQAAALPGLRAEVATLQLAGPVGTLGALGERGPMVRATLAARLGLADPGGSWQVDRGRLGALAGWLAGLTGALGKIGLDLGLMAQDGVGAATLSGGASSSMPHKVNPVDAELLAALARHGAMLLGGWHQAIHENERSGAAWTLEWLVLPPMVEGAGAATLAAGRLVASIVSIGEPAVGDEDGGPVGPVR